MLCSSFCWGRHTPSRKITVARINIPGLGTMLVLNPHVHWAVLTWKYTTKAEQTFEWTANEHDHQLLLLYFHSKISWHTRKEWIPKYHGCLHCSRLLSFHSPASLPWNPWAPQKSEIDRIPFTGMPTALHCNPLLSFHFPANPLTCGLKSAIY
jgi:hypothetical protein